LQGGKGDVEFVFSFAWFIYSVGGGDEFIFVYNYVFYSVDVSEVDF
jgi:hypothetical protein